jgi:hypothetical protein
LKDEFGAGFSSARAALQLFARISDSGGEHGRDHEGKSVDPGAERGCNQPGSRGAQLGSLNGEKGVSVDAWLSGDEVYEWREGLGSWG